VSIAADAALGGWVVAAALPFSQLVVDAEVVVLDARGLPSFSLLQKRGRLTRRADVARAALELPASIYAFDLLAFEGLDLRALPLVERKAALRALLPVAGALRYSEHFESQGEALFAEAERLGLEGIIGKRAASPYVAKRSTDWIKINAAKSDDFVVVGYLPPKQGGKGFGALLLAQHRDGVLTYAGRAGSGFAARDFVVLEPLLAAKPRAINRTVGRKHTAAEFAQDLIICRCTRRDCCVREIIGIAYFTAKFMQQRKDM